MLSLDNCIYFFHYSLTYDHFCSTNCKTITLILKRIIEGCNVINYSKKKILFYNYKSISKFNILKYLTKKYYSTYPLADSPIDY